MPPGRVHTHTHTHTHVHAYSHTHCLFIEPPHEPPLFDTELYGFHLQATMQSRRYIKSPASPKDKTTPICPGCMCLCAYYYGDVMLGMQCVFQSRRLYRDNSHRVEFVSLSLSPKQTTFLSAHVWKCWLGENHLQGTVADQFTRRASWGNCQR